MKCGKQAVYYRPYSGENLCKKHFLESIERKVARTIARHKMLHEADKIGVGISGGKDSTVLLHILKKIEQRFPKSSLIALTVDEGISGYREEGLKLARQVTSKFEIEHVIASFKELYGYSLDEIVDEMIDLMKPRFFMPIHGQYSMLAAHAELAKDKGIPEKNVVNIEESDIFVFNS